MSILNIVENFNNINLSFLKLKPDISFLREFDNKKILMIGYSNDDLKLDNIRELDIEKIKLKINNYDLFVISDKINYKPRLFIKKLLKLFEKNKKDYIFSGYFSYLNLNLDNSNNMFRPIDITRDPFNLKASRVLKNGISPYYFIQYLILLTFTIYLNMNFNKFLYKFLTIIVLLFALFIPFKKIVYIKNE